MKAGDAAAADVDVKRQFYVAATGCYNKSGWTYVHAPQPPVAGFPRGHRVRRVTNIHTEERQDATLRSDIIHGTIDDSIAVDS